ncbi:8-oxo-dGTP diphosphatase MutT [Veronia pacifica]|uniref:8-oxo-dGTP diphosphatase n=1 Tax=Veronia pacifica TaxID=1080227 RepID=A0A1C3ELH8_9GAMM|nr:8-oxo-dGTP diphosphatase MutT [Veronia pacifica]ODA34081.1 7,8-dihydro-8-oxoguanine-triphosphatase [Veronia pacifica]
MEKKRVHIAAGIILNHNETEVYITQRDANSHKGGFWEFPGGKVETGETAEQAVIRELVEEVGIQAHRPEPFLSLNHDYPEKSLSFDFFLIKDFEGMPFGKEGQKGLWASISELNQYAFPEANSVVLEKLFDRRNTLDRQ